MYINTLRDASTNSIKCVGNQILIYDISQTNSLFFCSLRITLLFNIIYEIQEKEREKKKGDQIAQMKVLLRSSGASTAV